MLAAAATAGDDEDGLDLTFRDGSAGGVTQAPGTETGNRFKRLCLGRGAA